MHKKWRWIKQADGSISIYHDNNLCWELDGVDNYTNEEINFMVKNFILTNQYLIQE